MPSPIAIDVVAPWHTTGPPAFPPAAVTAIPGGITTSTFDCVNKASIIF